MDLVKYIRSHGHKAHLSAAGDIIAIERSSRTWDHPNSEKPVVTFHSQAVRIEPTRRTVREWLGY